MPLTDLANRRAKPVDEPQKLSDAGGPYLFYVTVLAQVAGHTTPGPLAGSRSLCMTRLVASGHRDTATSVFRNEKKVR
ncbi:hypothetical protein [uncultured Stenotrophomonas sp.]|uniref:hypothetical protein n=1 Tax=uncultured Stenotrophomonas sp. TaxID=165438 RepID=UPI0025CFCC15|nr:hypothetical protein [uncultured Stenotrophomonas sp.]